MKKKYIYIFVVIIILTNITFATSNIIEIHVLKNQVVVEVNGDKVPVDNFLYEGTTYVPLRAVSEMLGADVGWIGETRTATIDTTSSGKEVMNLLYANPVDPFKPVFDLGSLDLSGDDIVFVTLEGNDDQQTFSLENNQLTLTSDKSDYGANLLSLDTTYEMTIYMKSGDQRQLTFKTDGLQAISQTSNHRVYYVPPMPNEGFSWPYYLVIPSNSYVNDNDNATSKKYLMLEGCGNGSSASMDVHYNKMTELYLRMQKGYGGLGQEQATRLDSPYLMPAIPRPSVGYYSQEDGHNFLYTHALDRDTALLNEYLDTADFRFDLIQSFERIELDHNLFRNIDEQVLAMTDHARTYLKENDILVEEQLFMFGYSARGSFSDRLVTLHPNKFKAYASGSTADDIILPGATYKGKNLIFPIGTYDYEVITGRPFNLNDHNKVARLIFMGQEDTNNVILYDDGYGNRERDIITTLWGEPVYNRALALIDLYGEMEGKGIFILDKGIGHSMSSDMSDYVREFFSANRDSLEATYPLPKDPDQLKYTIHE